MFKFIINDLVKSNYAGVEATIKSYSKKLSYADKSYQETNSTTHGYIEIKPIPTSRN